MEDKLVKGIGNIAIWQVDYKSSQKVGTVWTLKQKNDFS
jgi:hypothetical protein